METVRTFVAVVMPPEVGRAIGELEKRLHVPGVMVKWVEPENVHLTLKFLGEVAVDRLEPVFAAVERACRGLAPFELSLVGVGAFPNVRRPRVVWVGLERGREDALRLAGAVERELTAEGFDPEDRDFKAHITVGRVKDESRGASMLGERISAERLALTGIRVARVDVMKSQLTRQGPVYTVQREVALLAAEGSG